MPPDFQVRAALPDEAGLIKRMVRAERLNPLGLDWQRFRVAVASGGEVVGCMQVKIHQDGSHELASLVVLPGWRRRGAARSLIEDCLRRIRGELYLMCRAGLESYYHQFGFAAIGFEQMPPYFRRISRLAGALGGLRRDREGLLVMRVQIK